MLDIAVDAAAIGHDLSGIIQVGIPTDGRMNGRRGVGSATMGAVTVELNAECGMGNAE